MTHFFIVHFTLSSTVTIIIYRFQHIAHFIIIFSFSTSFLTERLSRKEIIVKIKDKSSASVVEALEGLRRIHRGNFSVLQFLL